MQSLRIVFSMIMEIKKGFYPYLLQTGSFFDLLQKKQNIKPTKAVLGVIFYKIQIGPTTLAE